MDNKKKILQILFEEPNRDFHIRLLARLAKLHPNTVMNTTDMLAKEGLIKKKKNKQTNFSIIQANTGNRKFQLLKRFYNVEKIYDSGLIDKLNEELAYPTIILFGSYAKAENTKESDIDLFIIAVEKKCIDTSVFLHILGTEVQLFIHTKKEFEKLRKNNKELINNVMNGIVLEGYVEAV
jgi:predicted nucleotidyltransferase